MFNKSWKDAKKVVSRGNMFMLAIGLLLGSAFGLVVNSLANDIITGAIAKGAGFDSIAYMSAGTTKWEVVQVFDPVTKLTTKAQGLPLNGIMYGKFIAALIGFIIIATFIFIGLLVAYMIINYRRRNVPAPAPAGPTVEEQILLELKQMNSAIASSKNMKEELAEKSATKRRTKK
ncbi:MAG: MscL family protein [Mycoplasmatales bacterium]|nr:MscL family protein [Mycoplasmatales bacterium]